MSHSHSIYDLIKTDKYLNDVLTIVKTIGEITHNYSKYKPALYKPHYDFVETCGAEVIIYGGFIRDLMLDNIPKDVDLWLDFGIDEMGYARWRNWFTYIYFSLLEQGYVITFVSDINDLPSDKAIEYSVYKLTISREGKPVNFDLSVNMKLGLKFADISDFTVNNLAMKQDGQLFVRSDSDSDSEFTLDEHINDIYSKRIRNIAKESIYIKLILERALYASYSLEHARGVYLKIIDMRLKKTLERLHVHQSCLDEV